MFDYIKKKNKPQQAKLSTTISENEQRQNRIKDIRLEIESLKTEFIGFQQRIKSAKFSLAELEIQSNTINLKDQKVLVGASSEIPQIKDSISNRNTQKTNQLIQNDQQLAIIKELARDITDNNSKLGSDEKTNVELSQKRLGAAKTRKIRKRI